MNEILREYLELGSSDGKSKRQELRKQLKKLLGESEKKAFDKALAVSILYQAMKDTKTYLKTMELQGHVPMLRPHQKIMAEINSALEQRKDLFE